MKHSRQLSELQIDEFLAKHQLPEAFRNVIAEYYLPLAQELPERRRQRSTYLLGINGAQGTGKSTLADFLHLSARAMYNWNIAVLSIDDFYYTYAQRVALAKSTHPLLKTRGVPGTHDMEMLARCLAALHEATADTEVSLPRFNKAIDDRAEKTDWPVVEGPIDMIILEGWCIGTQPQTEQELIVPINSLEHDEDPDGSWRKYVNRQLHGSYATVFEQLDTLLFLQAPGFESIRNWRIEQEQKLAGSAKYSVTKIMSNTEVIRFIDFYERLTRANLDKLPGQADIVLRLNEAHEVTEKKERVSPS